MPPTLQQRIILISGAAGTLGRAATLACAAAGATVILLDKNLAGLERVYDEIVAVGAPTPALYPLDLEGANEAHFAELALSIEQEFGRLHGLLHAATAAGTLGPILDLGAGEVERILRVNCTAPLQLTRALLPLLTRTGEASIVFVSDSAARRAKAYWGAYAMSKLALEGLARILDEETQGTARIRVHTFTPGPFKSPVHLRAFPGGDRDSLPDAHHFGPILVGLLAGDGQAPAHQGVESGPAPSSHHMSQAYVR